MHKIGKYQWSSKDFLGEGSFGKVYKGINTENGQQVMKKLKSPNVVRMYDVFNDSKTTYIILEFCKDGDLDHYIRKNGGLLNEKEALDVLNQLLNGFKNLVELGYIHRDIKPANALINNGIHKVADFGFATKIDIAGRQLIREMVGTPLYMAPQLLEQQPYTSKSDIWSIGMVFYEMLFGKTPWSCRDLKSFVRNMKTQRLRFPYSKPIGSETKNFLQGCLQVSESNRFSWEQVLNHPIAKKETGNIEKHRVDFDEKAKTIINKMQEIIQAQGIDPMKIFQKFDADNSGQLDYKEFYKFLCSIDPRITSSESAHIFKLVDTHKSGTISKQEFQDLFINYDFSDLNDKGQHIIKDLKEIIKAHKLDINKIFYKFDKDKGGTLDKQELGKLLRVIAPKLRDFEVEDCMKKFDKDGDGQVSLKEFQDVLAYGLQQGADMYDPKYEKSKKLIHQLKSIIMKYKLNLKDVFKNFDKSGDGNLDIQEFAKLCLVLDKNIQNDEIKCVFGIFDTDQGGTISVQEFYQMLS
ncbi:Protein kinase-like domain [Pseudocohnilembus persalinus]|uniref:Protein kinase-like domain n=1 Tax=Pseudocohnilembus persalinus TaxID=266149 RepID=A0A0V0QHT3_PSEPJ|nr:Protein kinase-like domain [Pseudocohnilembus persalinus]|eukprot:KRX01734.1 Protein kinase-like domain [Pseudocohnilembus persalinus]